MRSRKLRLAVAICASVAACKWSVTPGEPAIEVSEARVVGDAFMADLVADDVAQALTRMESAFADLASPSQADEMARKLFEHCGRPVDAEYKTALAGFKIYLDGSHKNMQKLFYEVTTTSEPKGVCVFAVEIVPDGNRLAVTSFGPLRVQQGEWPASFK